MTSFRSGFEAWWDPFFPPRCSACDMVGAAPYCRICSDALLDGAQVSLRGFGLVHALWLYGGPVRFAIQRMKYQRRVEIARSLSLAIPPGFFDALRFDFIIPVPLSRRRLWQRGFNPAFEICRRSTRVPVNFRVLRRRGVQLSQVGLGPRDRHSNVSHAFTAKSPEILRGKRVLLVDDVMTTGATLLAAGQVLRMAGVRHLEALVLARSDIQDPNIVCL